MALKLGGLLEHRCWAPAPVSDSAGLGYDLLRICIYDQVSGSVGAAGPGATLLQALIRGKAEHERALILMSLILLTSLILLILISLI